MSATLRFAYVGGEFIVYDAFNGPCSREIPYRVINGQCNETYSPLDRPNHTVAGGGCFERNPSRYKSTPAASLKGLEILSQPPC